jgi:hypothetical protein
LQSSLTTKKTPFVTKGNIAELLKKFGTQQLLKKNQYRPQQPERDGVSEYSDCSHRQA